MDVTDDGVVREDSPLSSIIPRNTRDRHAGEPSSPTPSDPPTISSALAERFLSVQAEMVKRQQPTWGVPGKRSGGVQLEPNIDIVAERAKTEAETSQAMSPTEKQKPIRFKDALGRKFTFPFEMCKTWKGMNELVTQAFVHVEPIGEMVENGNYDLTGPTGEIILPIVWESVIEPDWAIAMHMWPIKEPEEENVAPLSIELNPGLDTPVSGPRDGEMSGLKRAQRNRHRPSSCAPTLRGYSEKPKMKQMPKHGRSSSLSEFGPRPTKRGIRKPSSTTSKSSAKRPLATMVESEDVDETESWDEDDILDFLALTAPKDNVESGSGSKSSSDTLDIVLVDPAPTLVEKKGQPSGVDMADKTNIRQRYVGGRRGGKGAGGRRPPSEDRDVERGEDPSPKHELSRGRNSSVQIGRARGDPEDNSPSPGPESFATPRPKRSHPCLGVATLLCVILGVISFAILGIAFKDGYVSEHSSQNGIQECVSKCQRASLPRMPKTIDELESFSTIPSLSVVNDPNFYFSLQSSGWLTLGIISALIPSCKHAQKYQKWLRMSYVWVPAAISLALGIISPLMFVHSQAVSNGLAGLAGAMQAMVIYYATFEVFVEEKIEEIGAIEMRNRGRKRRNE